MLALPPLTPALALFWATVVLGLLAQAVFLIGAFRRDFWVGLASFVLPPLGWGIAFYAPASARQRLFAALAIAALIAVVAVSAVWTGRLLR